MNTNRSGSVNPLNKMEDLHKQKLKMVMYRNKYFPNGCLKRKTQLIRKLLTDERKSLNIDEELDSDEENSIANQLRSDLLDKERSNISYYNEIPGTLPKSLPKQAERSKKMPTIAKRKFKKFLTLLGNDKILHPREKNVKVCVDHIHTSAKPLWTSPSSIMKAVNDCILTRNWNNLTQLLLFMIHLPSEKYKPLIRHLCQIMDSLHPVIQENDLQGQLKLVHKAIRRIRKFKASEERAQLVTMLTDSPNSAFVSVMTNTNVLRL